ncbi:hypothetical protein TNCV_1373131 [Trichonephila clavipes]|uniref:DUF4817 domain-containing protein n=1 Tax=Trichonephila clavipes TaxID=2585209 RepID=A0A8X7BLC6_TRICX|nr:hypothetical protein TNCV_1373131 [Trichonephila clavipes]
MKSPIKVQCRFQRFYESKPPGTKPIRQCSEMLKEISSVKDLPRSGRPSVSEETAELNTWRELEYRLNNLRATLRAHDEIY